MSKNDIQLRKFSRMLPYLLLFLLYIMYMERLAYACVLYFVAVIIIRVCLRLMLCTITIIDVMQRYICHF